MKDFTIIHNPLLRPSKLTINARYLLCVLIRYCGNKDNCYPTQALLAKDLGISVRQISVYIKELIQAGLVIKKRKGYSRPNTYQVAKHFTIDSVIKDDNKKSTSDKYKQYPSDQLRSTYPLYKSDKLPANNTYLISKDNNGFNKAAFDKCRRDLETKGILRKKQNILCKYDSKTTENNLSEVLFKKSQILASTHKTIDSTPLEANRHFESQNSVRGHKDGYFKKPLPPENLSSKNSLGHISNIDSGHTNKNI